MCKRGRDVAVTGLDRGVKRGRGAAVTRLVDRGESVPREEAEWSGEGTSERATRHEKETSAALLARQMMGG